MRVVAGAGAGEFGVWRFGICGLALLAMGGAAIAGPVLDVAVVPLTILVEPVAAIAFGEPAEGDVFERVAVHFTLRGNAITAVSVKASGYDALVHLRSVNAAAGASSMRVDLEELDQVAHGLIDLVLPAGETRDYAPGPAGATARFVELTVSAAER